MILIWYLTFHRKLLFGICQFAKRMCSAFWHWQGTWPWMFFAFVHWYCWSSCSYILRCCMMLHCRKCPLHSWEICMLELQPEPETVSNNSCVLSLPRIVLPADFSSAPPCFGASIMETSDTDSYICCTRFVHMYITLCIWYNWYNWYNCNVHNIDNKKTHI